MVGLLKDCYVPSACSVQILSVQVVSIMLVSTLRNMELTIHNHIKTCFSIESLTKLK